MALPEVLMTSAYNAGPPVNVNDYTPRKGADWDGQTNDPAYINASIGPVPTDRPLYGVDIYFLEWVGNRGQVSIHWRYTNAAARDDEYAAAIATIGAPVS